MLHSSLVHTGTVTSISTSDTGPPKEVVPQPARRICEVVSEIQKPLVEQEWHLKASESHYDFFFKVTEKISQVYMEDFPICGSEVG